MGDESRGTAIPRFPASALVFYTLVCGSSLGALVLGSAAVAGGVITLAGGVHALLLARERRQESKP